MYDVYIYMCNNNNIMSYTYMCVCTGDIYMLYITSVLHLYGFLPVSSVRSAAAVRAGPVRTGRILTSVYPLRIGRAHRVHSIGCAHIYDGIHEKRTCIPYEYVASRHTRTANTVRFEGWMRGRTGRAV